MKYFRVLYGCFLLGVLLVAPACAPKAKIPMPVLEYGQIEASGNTRLLVFLRGIGGDYTDFEKYGLIEEVKSRNLPFDIIVPDAHYGYYKTETIEERLKIDIIDPARAKGYQQIWLAGFSMGGLGSLFYIKHNPEDITGVVLVSPFMGWSSIRNEIEDAGGIKNWQPQNSEADDWQFLIWDFVHSYSAHPEDYPPVYLGYGDDDSLAGHGSKLLSAALDQDRVFEVAGEHDYETFQVIWAEHLDRLERQEWGSP